MSAVQRLTAPRTIPWWICALGLLALYVPTVWNLAVNLWFGEAQEQSQGLIVLLICIWLI